MDFDAMVTGIVSLALFGLTGSLHCAAMCGTLAASACGLPRTNARSATLYLATRAVAYSLLGATVGLLSAVTIGSQLSEMSRPLALAFGAITIAYALNEAWSVWSGRARSVAPNLWRRLLGHLQAALQALPFPRALVLGVTTALLPCGFLAAALVQAALFANPVHAALAMLAFAMASSPSLFGGGRLLAFLGRRWPRATPYLAATMLALAGASMIVRAWHVHDHHAEHSEHHHTN